MDFADRLRELRRKNNITQKQAAEAMSVGLRHWQKYEGRNETPTFERLIMIADYFDVSLDYLVGRSDCPERR